MVSHCVGGVLHYDKGGEMEKIIAFFKSAAAMLLAFALLIVAAVAAVVFSPVWLRTLLAVADGLGILILAVRALLLRKDMDKA